MTLRTFIYVIAPSLALVWALVYLTKFPGLADPPGGIGFGSPLSRSQLFSTPERQIRAHVNQGKVVDPSHRYRSDGEGVLENGTSLLGQDAPARMTISSPWYGSSYAQAGYLLVLAALGYGVYRWRKRGRQAAKKAEKRQQQHSSNAQYIADITYELRMPINIISTMTEQLLRNQGEQVREASVLIQHCTNKLQTLVNEMQDFSRLPSGHLPLKMRHQDVVPFARNLLESYRLLAEAQAIKVHFCPQVSSLHTDFDAQQLGALLSYLFSTVIRQTASGGNIQLRIAREKGHGGESCLIEVHGQDLAAGEKGPARLNGKRHDMATPNLQLDRAGEELAVLSESARMLGGDISTLEVGKGISWLLRLPVTAQAPRRHPDQERSNGIQQANLPVVSPNGKGQDPEEPFLQKLRQVIEENLDDEQFGITRICQLMHLSRSHLHRKLEALTGQSTSHFLRSMRLNRAMHLLKTTDLNVSQVAYQVGFKNRSHFTQVFTKEFGDPPSHFRRG